MTDPQTKVSSLALLHGLVEKWRRRALVLTSDREVMRDDRIKARMLLECANELASALAALPAQHEETKGDTRMDTMGSATDSRTATNEAIRALLDNHVRRTELGYTERFEEDAEQFYRETGFMAPGKSVPFEMASTQQDDKREAAWNTWTGKMRVDFCAMLRAASAALSTLPAQGWQPIETAQKDGIFLLLYPVHGMADVGQWFDSRAGGWWISHAVQVNPTHWKSAAPPASLPERQEPT